MAAYRELCAAAEALSQDWSADEAVRNRPDRQKLCGELMLLLPRPLAFGKVCDQIEQSITLS